MAKRLPPLLSVPTMSAPAAAPNAPPLAPNRLAPPITHAAIALSSYPVPAVGMPAFRREVKSTPPTAASRPAIA